MAKLTSFNDFVNTGQKSYDDTPSYRPIENSDQPKPYIYIIKYIMGKEEYVDELKDFILNYQDDQSDYEDSNSYDPFMNKLKVFASQDDIEELEDMISNYNEYVSEDFDGDDDDFEEKMYKEYVNDEEDDYEYEEREEEIEFSTLSDKLKNFLKMGDEDDDDEDILEEDEDEMSEEEVVNDNIIDIEYIEYEDIIEDESKNIIDIDLDEIVEETDGNFTRAEFISMKESKMSKLEDEEVKPPVKEKKVRKLTKKQQKELDRLEQEETKNEDL